MIYGEKDGAATALRAPSESAQYCFPNHHAVSKFVSSTFGLCGFLLFSCGLFLLCLCFCVVLLLLVLCVSVFVRY